MLFLTSLQNKEIKDLLKFQVCYKLDLCNNLKQTLKQNKITYPFTLKGLYYNYKLYLLQLGLLD